MGRPGLRGVLAAVAAGALLVGAGCSADDEPAGTGSSQPPPASSPAPEPSGSAPAGSPSAASPAPGPSETPIGPVVATRSTSVNGKTIRLTLYPIVRAGDLATLNLTLSSSDDVAIDQLLGDGDPGSSSNVLPVADGIRLVDGARKKLYLVASEEGGSCLCSSLGGVRLADDRPYVVFATFAAPPGETTAVDVQVPNFGVFSGVPVS